VSEQIRRPDPKPALRSDLGIVANLDNSTLGRRRQPAKIRAASAETEMMQVVRWVVSRDGLQHDPITRSRRVGILLIQAKEILLAR
jgi:hypothetical protein